MAKAAVYRILNLVTGEFYVGATTQSLTKRLGQHLATAFAGRKWSTGPLHEAMRKYGKPAFVIELIGEYELAEAAFAEEARLIEALKPAMNIMRGGIGRAVICLDDGLVFESASHAAKHYGAHKSAVIEVCLRNPRRAQAAGRVFRYVGDVVDVAAELATAKKRTEEKTFAMRRTRGQVV